MIELIKIATNEQGSNVVSARDLYNFLEIKTDFTDWCKRMFEYGFQEEIDYILLKNGEKVSKTNPINYALTINCAKEIAMIQRSEKGKEARLYFIECEKQLKSLVQKEYSVKELLQMQLATIERAEIAEQKVENLTIALDSSLEWSSIVKVATFNKVHESVFKWRVLKAKSNEMGYVIKKLPSTRYTNQNAYHVNCFRACYPEYNYDFNKQLQLI